MKTLRVLMLLLILPVCGYAGDMDNGSPGTPPPVNAAANNTTVMEGTETANSKATEPTATDLALSLLQNILSIF